MTKAPASQSPLITAFSAPMAPSDIVRFIDMRYVVVAALYLLALRAIAALAKYWGLI